MERKRTSLSSPYGAGPGRWSRDRHSSSRRDRSRSPARSPRRVRHHRSHHHHRHSSPVEAYQRPRSPHRSVTSRRVQAQTRQTQGEYSGASGSGRSREAHRSRVSDRQQPDVRLHTLSFGPNSERVCEQWFQYSHVMRTLQPRRYGNVSAREINHKPMLDSCLERADREPLAVKKELDAALLRDGHGSFNDRETSRVRYLENQCFQALHPGTDIGASLACLPYSHKGLSQAQVAKAQDAAQRLAGWQLHFRASGRQQRIRYYVQQVLSPQSFDGHLDMLFKLMAQGRHREVEGALLTLFDSGFIVPLRAMTRVKTLMGMVCRKLYGFSHPIEQALERASDCANPVEVLRQCDSVARDSDWFAPEDWINITRTRLAAAAALELPEIIREHLLFLPDRLALLSFKYRSLIEHGFYLPALATIKTAYTRLPPYEQQQRRDAQQAELQVSKLLAEKEWNQGQGFKPQWQSRQRSSWQGHKESLIGLGKSAKPADGDEPQSMPLALFAYLVTHLTETTKARYVQARIWEAGCQLAYNNPPLLATRVNGDDQQLTLWSVQEQGNPHPEAQLASLFSRRVPAKLEVLAMVSPCHNPKHTPGGCIQELRDLVRQYPNCQWHYSYLSANPRELATTGLGLRGDKPLHELQDHQSQCPEQWRKLPDLPSQVQLDTHELNLYDNIRYGYYDQQKKYQDFPYRKPHGINAARSEEQLTAYIDSHWTELTSVVKGQEQQVKEAMTEADQDQLNSTRMAVIDNLERYCSLNLYLIRGGWAKNYKNLMQTTASLPEELVPVLKSFASYLFDRKQPDIIPQEGDFSVLPQGCAGIPIGENCLLRAARCHSLARWLHQQWFSQPVSVEPK